MRLYLSAKTNIPDVYIDFIEVRLKNGEEVSLNWDESDISRSEEGFDARYKGVYFGEEYANGRLADLEALKVTDIGLYYESTGTFYFQIVDMLFEDYEKSLSISNPVILKNCSGLGDIVTEISLNEQSPFMINDFDKLIEQVSKGQYKSNCSSGNWSFEPHGDGAFIVSHNGEPVVACENNQIVDAKWGSRIAGIEVCDILTSLLKHIPQVHLDAMTIRTDDCLDVLGYEGPSYRIADIPGLEDIDYYRAWVTSKANITDPEKKDYVVYWDQGNTWCEVLAVFEGVSHEEFVAELHNKYHEWIREDSEFTQSLPEPAGEKASLNHMIQSASSYLAESHSSDGAIPSKGDPDR